MNARGQASAYPVQPRLGARPKNALLAALAVLLLVFLFMGTSNVDTVVAGGREAAARIQQNMPDVEAKLDAIKQNVHMPERLSRPFSHLHNPFKPGAHPPPQQANSTSGEASWFSDWKWLNPFSSTVTLDEDRALLPPIIARPPVYTYYEPRNKEKEGPLAQAEAGLLEVWRRAWWAQGFKPVVLGPKDAMENQLYERVHMVKMTPAVKLDLMRLLAWSHMGDGILANWLVVPMAGYYSPLLVNLREGRHQALTRYQDLDMGLFAGSKVELDKAIDTILGDAGLSKAESLLDLIKSQKELFNAETGGQGIAFYSDKNIHDKYPDLSSVVTTSAAKGYRMLADQINAHLHQTFLSQFPGGIAVVSPFAKNATLVPHRALAFAKVLNTCPKDPAGPHGDERGSSSTCPPDNPKCVWCDPIPIHFPSATPNSTTTFTIGTVPHAYTFTRLLAPHDPDFNFTLAYIRRNMSRDPFIETVTAKTAPAGISSYERIVRFKESIAQPGKGAMRSIWRHAEADWDWEALEWRLGFALKRPGQADVNDAYGEAVPQVVIPDLEVPDVPEGMDGKFPDVLKPLLDSMGKEDEPGRPERSDISEQSRIMKRTGEQLGKKKWTGQGYDLRKVAEAWNLADIEAWKFVRALSAREIVLRRKWMNEERKYKA